MYAKFLLDHPVYTRVPTGQGKQGKPGKVREIENMGQKSGKRRKIVAKVREKKKKLKRSGKSQGNFVYHAACSSQISVISVIAAPVIFCFTVRNY